MNIILLGRYLKLRSGGCYLYLIFNFYGGEAKTLIIFWGQLRYCVVCSTAQSHIRYSVTYLYI